MLNDLMEKRKKTLAESEEHKNRRNELNAAASKFARDRNTLNNQTREFVEEAQKNKDKSVEAGREYVEAYVAYTHYVEGIHAAIKSAGGHHPAGAAAEHREHK